MGRKRTITTKGWHIGREVQKLIGPGRSTTENVATTLKTSSATLYRWMLRPDWPEHLVLRMADYLHVSPEWLATGRGPKMPSGDELALEVRMERILDRYMYDMRLLAKRYQHEIVMVTKDPAASGRGPGEPLVIEAGR